MCLSGTPPDCNDGDHTTIDECVETYVGTPGVRGTGGEVGVNGEIGEGYCDHLYVGWLCEVDEECDDHDLCTDDACVTGVCQWESIMDRGDCDDLDPCTADMCDEVQGCVHNALQNCCIADADCDDESECTNDTCNTDTNACEYTANGGDSCTYSDECYTGLCGDDGLCYPDNLLVPINDTCDNPTEITLSEIGEACQISSTMCARHDYQASCETGWSTDMVYSFTVPPGIGWQDTKTGIEYSSKQHSTCHITDGDAVGCCIINWWQYTFDFPTDGNYWAGAETTNYSMDLGMEGRVHQVKVYIDGAYRGEFNNPATMPEHQFGSTYLGWVTAGTHTVRFHWVNDWCIPPLDSNIKIHSVWVQEDKSIYQMYSYNVILDGEDFNTSLYAMDACGDRNTEYACNDNCSNTSILDCDVYGLGLFDSALTVTPFPVGFSPTLYFTVDGRAGDRGDFELHFHRVTHNNNPCLVEQDNILRVDATKGGMYRGNINGYLNDVLDDDRQWFRTPCHDSMLSPGTDWPAHAWFLLAPDVDTTYTVWTDEQTPLTWFDTVISVFDNTAGGGCSSSSERQYLGTCAHLNGQNGPGNPTRLTLTVPAGRQYMIGISAYERPTAGNYIVHFDIGGMTVPTSCADQKSRYPMSTNGIYTIDPDGGGGVSPFQVYCDMTTDGGGWTLVLLSNSAVNGCPRPSWTQVINNVNYNGSLSTNLSSFDMFMGVRFWNQVAPGADMRLDMGSNPASLAHRAYYDFSLSAGSNYQLNMSNENIAIRTTGTGSSGMYSYHRGRQLTTYNSDHDANGGNCATYYNNAAWWYGSCWSGSFWGECGAGSYQDAPYWYSSGGEYWNYGSIWVR